MSVLSHFRGEEYTDLIESLVYSSKDKSVSYYLSIMSYLSETDGPTTRGYRLVATVMSYDPDDDYNLDDDEGGKKYGEHISSHSLSGFYNTPTVPYALAQMVSLSVKLDEGFVNNELHLDIFESIDMKLSSKSFGRTTSMTLDLFDASYEIVWDAFSNQISADEVDTPEVMQDQVIRSYPSKPNLKLVVNNDAV